MNLVFRAGCSFCICASFASSAMCSAEDGTANVVTRRDTGPTVFLKRAAMDARQEGSRTCPPHRPGRDQSNVTIRRPQASR